MPIKTLANWCNTCSWIFHTVQFNCEKKIELNIEHTQLGPQRKNDRVLMELAMSFSTASTDLKFMNKFRMLHEVIHLSDIMTTNRAQTDPVFLISDPFPEQKNEYK